MIRVQKMIRQYRIRFYILKLEKIIVLMQQVQKNNKVQFKEQYLNANRVSDDGSLPELQQKTHHQLMTNKKLDDEINQQQQTIEACKQKLKRLVNFIKFHNIEAQQIWQSRRQLSANEFANVINDKYGFYLTNQELRILKKVLNKKDRISIKDLSILEIWDQQTGTISIARDFLSKSKLNSSSFKSSTANLKKSKKSLKNLDNTYSSQITKQKTNKPKVFENSLNEKDSSTFINGFQQAKKYSMTRAQNKLNQLKKDIQQSVLQNKWDFIVMAGQMNQWIQQIKKQKQKQSSKQNQKTQPICSFKYKVLNKDPIQIIQQNVTTFQEETIPHIVFIKKYQTLKKKMIKEQNHKNNLKGTVLMVLDQNQKLSKNALLGKIKDRDQELNFVLLQIMRMKSMFLWQNKILIDAGINS